MFSEKDKVDRMGVIGEYPTSNRHKNVTVNVLRQETDEIAVFVVFENAKLCIISHGYMHGSLCRMHTADTLSALKNTQL